MMVIKFLVSCGVQEIYLAGFDGYTHDVKENYGERQLQIITRNTVLDTMNTGMSKCLKEFSKGVKIHFLTTSGHVKL